MNLRESRILLVNDDGIDARGLSILEGAVRQYSEDVWVVAPATNQSGRARALSWRQDVAVERRGDKRFAVHGTPADCVLIALLGLLDERPADVVLSGVNAGSNLAEDVGSSGTVGACFQSVELGVPAIAFSQMSGEDPIGRWAGAQRLCAPLLPLLVDALHAPQQVLNVTFPSLAQGESAAGVAVTRSGWREGPLSLEERAPSNGRRAFHIYTFREDRPREPDCDLGLSLRGYVTVTPLGLDQTRHEDLAALRARLHGALPPEAASA